jgi:nitrogen fixation/metabolism regulation signal transduction histidine kinase
MRLRTKIFRKLVLFALIPSLIVTVVACYFLSEAIDRASAWLSISSPDRTINSLRLAEFRFQETAREFLSGSDFKTFSEIDSLFDWRVVVDGGIITESYCGVDLPPEVDSIFKAGTFDSESIRTVIENYLILGASVTRQERTVAAGFILDHEYMSGLKAATASLQESRNFQNLLPGFILFLLAAGATVLVMIVIGAYFISRRLSMAVTTPLEQLTTVTAAVARGDTPQSISVTGTEEISRLTETFNRMVEDLEASRKRLIAVERVAAWQEFARRMAHELKNPLTPISLSLYRIQHALEESGHYDKFADSIEAISAQVEHLKRIADDYSSLSRLPGPNMQKIEFTGLVRAVINLHASQLENYALEEEIPVDPISIEADTGHLHQVMVNLLKNGLEFTKPRKRIVISVSADDRSVSFAVANEGENVREADLRSAKMPYFSTRQGGTGLGLAISEKIIIDHGGSLNLGLVKGMTVARFKIPRRQPDHKAKSG